MSAKSYVNCPQCQRIVTKSKDSRMLAAESAYGRVSAAEYQRLVADIYDTQPPLATLGEYYEFDYREDGSFHCRYSAHCRECGFEFQTVHQVQNAVKES